MIDVSPELTAALRESAEILPRLREALKSSDREQYRRVMQAWLAAQQHHREAWLAMVTPVPTTTKE